MNFKNRAERQPDRAGPAAGPNWKTAGPSFYRPVRMAGVGPVCTVTSATFIVRHGDTDLDRLSAGL